MKEIIDICEIYCIENYTINSDGSVNVNGNVTLFNRELIKLPLKFGKVSGYFNCSLNNLISLEGCPQSVGGYFSCSNNELTTLEFCSQSVGSHFNCCSNYLTTLEGCAKSIGAGFSCSYNQLTTLEFCPQSVGGYFSCNNNKLTTLEFCPQSVGAFNFDNNVLTSLEGIKVCPKRISCSGNPLTEYEINNPREVVLKNIRDCKLKILGI